VTTAPSNSVSDQRSVELNPSYTIPLVLVVAAIPLALLQPWVGGPIALFGLFLLYQTATLRLVFTATDLDVLRSGTLIRRFPYAEWLNWRVFWPAFPVLFYFREVKSIHFLPVLFDPTALTACLEERCPRVE
jgi:Protein of unknown function (DUF3119)